MAQWTTQVSSRKTKALRDLIGDVRRQACSFIELHGIIGQPETESKSTLWQLFAPWRESVSKAYQAIGEKHQWIITDANYQTVVAELHKVCDDAAKDLPIDDKRQTQEQAAESARLIAEQQAEQQRQQEADKHRVEQERAAALKSDGLVRLTENTEKQGLELRFDNKPAKETIDRLKANGWRWSMRNRCWYIKRSDRAYNFAVELIKANEPVLQTAVA